MITPWEIATGDMEADGVIEVYHIETGTILATYEGLEVYDAMQELKWSRKYIRSLEEELLSLAKSSDYILRIKYSLHRLQNKATLERSPSNCIHCHAHSDLCPAHRKERDYRNALDKIDAVLNRLGNDQ